jgi:hypothetical protein
MTQKIAWLIALAGVLYVASGRLQAHHSFNAEFDSSKPVTLIGTVDEMQWINPHAWLFVNVPGPDGKVERWGFEFGPPNVLIRRGWTKSTVPPGMKVTVNAFLAKDGRKIANARNVLMPDGRKLFAGSGGDAPPEK